MYDLNPALQSFWLDPSRYKALFGGRASSKSHDAAGFAVYLARNYNLRFLCARQFQNKIEESVYTLIKNKIEAAGWENEFVFTRSSIYHKEMDVDFKVKENLIEFNRFKNIFGIRIALFEVDSEDEDYYEKPFNPDGITEGSYKGISQVDPYWMMPMLTAESTADPSSRFFYEPEFWIISGKKYHRSHLIIARGPQPADILKPTYIFGGVPLVQRIYERVYAAERTANEAPLLAMNKRTTVIHTDTAKAIAQEDKFLDRLMFWVKYRDNHAVKVLGTEESYEQHDTSLSDFDSVIMNQYQLVASIAKTPATKLLGTSPKERERLQQS